MQYYAHSTEKTDKSDWQPLTEHLEEVAERAEKLARNLMPGNFVSL